jgi:hypothetical protein
LKRDEGNWGGKAEVNEEDIRMESSERALLI